MGVLPLDDRTIELFGGTPRPGTPHARTRYDYLAPISHIPADVCPPLGGRPWTLTIAVIIDDSNTEGVLYARGSHNVGQSFFIKDGQLQFDYNALGTHFRAAAPLSLTPGHHTLTARFERAESVGTIVIGADGNDLASVAIPKLVRMLGSTGLDIGRDALSTVVSDYEGPFAFTGTIERASFQIHSRRDRADVLAQANTELARE